MADLQQRFEAIGMRFHSSMDGLRDRLDQIDSFLFDWDGVFNDGTKGHQVTSHFTEADSMGVNMLRFSYWLTTGRSPYCAIITGRQNESALHFAKREHFNAIYMGFTHKQEALDAGQLNAGKSAFFFDDILDLTIASQCGLRLLIDRKQSPLMKESLEEKKWVDVQTGSAGGQHAVREACEFLIGLRGNWDEVLSSRVAYDERYEQYLNERNSVETEVNKKSR